MIARIPLLLLFTTIVFSSIISVHAGSDTVNITRLHASITYDPLEDNGVFDLNITLSSRSETPVELTLDNPFDPSVNLSLVSVDCEPGGNVVVDYGVNGITILFNNTSWVMLYFTIEGFMESSNLGSYAAYIDLTGYNGVANLLLTLQIPYGYQVNVTPSTGVTVSQGNESIIVNLSQALFYTITTWVPVTEATTSPTATMTTITSTATSTTIGTSATAITTASTEPATASIPATHGVLDSILPLVIGIIIIVMIIVILVSYRYRR
jgi:hypothetical protein